MIINILNVKSQPKNMIYFPKKKTRRENFFFIDQNYLKIAYAKQKINCIKVLSLRNKELIIKNKIVI